MIHTLENNNSQAHLAKRKRLGRHSPAKGLKLASYPEQKGSVHFKNLALSEWL